MRATIFLPAFLAVLGIAVPAIAHIHDRPGLNIWASGLKNKMGGQCCEDSEAVRIDGPDWDSNGPDGEYRVFLEGQWIDVPPQAVVLGPNRYGPTLVWPFKNADGITEIRCFLPGAGA